MKNLKYWAQKITYKLTGAPSGQILNYIELEVENQNILPWAQYSGFGFYKTFEGMFGP